MPPPLALIGGEGFTPEFTPALRHLQQLAGGDEARIVVLPTAAAEDGDGVPQRRAAMAVEFFSAMGAQAEALMVVDDATANDPTLAEKTAKASWIHVSGGQPGVLYGILKDSLVWEAILDAHRQGALLVGSSAGAVILGEHAFTPQRPFPPNLEDVRFDPMPGFGLLPGISVGPHFNVVPPGLLDYFGRALPPDTTLVGIDEKTGLLREGASWRVIGAGNVTLVRDGKQDRYAPEAAVPLPA